MGVKLGLHAKLYRNTGSGGTPAWNEIPNVRDVTLNLETGEADVSTRGNGGWRANIGTLKGVLPASLPEAIFRRGYRGCFPFWGGRRWLGGSVATIRSLWHVGGSGLRPGGVRGRWGLGFRISSGRWL